MARALGPSVRLKCEEKGRLPTVKGVWPCFSAWGAFFSGANLPREKMGNIIGIYLPEATFQLRLVLDVYYVLNTQTVLSIRASNSNSSSGIFFFFLAHWTLRSVNTVM